MLLYRGYNNAHNGGITCERIKFSSIAHPLPLYDVSINLKRGMFLQSFRTGTERTEQNIFGTACIFQRSTYENNNNSKDLTKYKFLCAAVFHGMGKLVF